MNQKVSRFNIIYFSLFVLLPLIIYSAMIFAGWYYWILELLIAGGIVFLLYNLFAYKIISKIQRYTNEKQLNDMGFIQNFAYNEKTSNLYIDLNTSRVAMFFFFNPKLQFVSPEVFSKFKIRDFKSGVGVFAGTKNVAFDFKIEDSRFRFYTFTSNARWKMTSNYVVDAISEAEEVISFFEESKQKKAELAKNTTIVKENLSHDKPILTEKSTTAEENESKNETELAKLSTVQDVEIKPSQVSIKSQKTETLPELKENSDSTQTNKAQTKLKMPTNSQETPEQTPVLDELPKLDKLPTQNATTQTTELPVLDKLPTHEEENTKEKALIS